MAEKENCAEVVGSGWDRYGCSRYGVVHEAGKKWCKQHAPSAKQSRRAERDAGWKSERQRAKREREIEDAKAAIIESALTYDAVHLPPYLGALVEALRKLLPAPQQSKD